MQSPIDGLADLPQAQKEALNAKIEEMQVRDRSVFALFESSAIALFCYYLKFLKVLQ